MNKDDSQQPPLGEEKDPDTDSSETPEPPSDPIADTAPKPKKRGFGKFLFVLLLLIGTAGGTAYYYELKQKKFQQDLESRLYTLGRAANDRPHQNSKDLHFLTEKFEQFQVQVADATRRQTETIEALRQEINQLKSQINTGSADILEEDSTPPEPEMAETQENVAAEQQPPVAEPNEVGGEEALPGPVEEQPAPEPAVEETQSTEEPTETLTETDEEENTEAEDQEPVEVAEAVTEPEEEVSAEQEAPVEEEPEPTTESPELNAVESQETEEETVAPEPVEAITTESVVVANPETVVIVPAPPQPEPSPEETDLQRTEGEQEYIDFVETTSGKFFRLVGEGASKLWDYLSGLF